MTVVVLACQVGLFHLKLTQINSEINFKAKNKCPDSQKLDMRELERPHMSRPRTCICLHSLSTLSLWVILFEKRKASENLTSILKQSLFCWMFVLLLECDRSVIRSHEDLIRFNNNIPWLACTIHNYANMLFVFVFFCDTSKASENLTFILILLSVCVIIVWSRRPIGDSHQDLMRFKNNKRT